MCIENNHQSYFVTIYQEYFIHSLGLTLSTPGLVKHNISTICSFHSFNRYNNSYVPHHACCLLCDMGRMGWVTVSLFTWLCCCCCCPSHDCDNVPEPSPLATVARAVERRRGLGGRVSRRGACRAASPRHWRGQGGRGGASAEEGAEGAITRVRFGRPHPPPRAP